LGSGADLCSFSPQQRSHHRSGKPQSLRRVLSPRQVLPSRGCLSDAPVLSDLFLIDCDVCEIRHYKCSGNLGCPLPPTDFLFRCLCPLLCQPYCFPPLIPPPLQAPGSPERRRSPPGRSLRRRPPTDPHPGAHTPIQFLPFIGWFPPSRILLSALTFFVVPRNEISIVPFPIKETIWSRTEK